MKTLLHSSNDESDSTDRSTVRVREWYDPPRATDQETTRVGTNRIGAATRDTSQYTLIGWQDF